MNLAQLKLYLGRIREIASLKAKLSIAYKQIDSLQKKLAVK
jgi:hypothetical protein